MPVKFKLTLAALLLLVASACLPTASVAQQPAPPQTTPQPAAKTSAQTPPAPAPSAAAPNPLLGSWFTAIQLPDHTAEDLYQTFDDQHFWHAVYVFRDRTGKIVRRTAEGSFILTAAADGTYRLLIDPCDWAPRHTCVENQSCTTWQPVAGTNGFIRFPDPAHFLYLENKAVSAQRLERLPIEAADPVASILMVTATGEPSKAPIPVGLDSTPFSRQGCRAKCDDLQQQRICNLHDGLMYTDKHGCQRCAQ